MWLAPPGLTQAPHARGAVGKRLARQDHLTWGRGGGGQGAAIAAAEVAFVVWTATIVFAERAETLLHVAKLAEVIALHGAPQEAWRRLVTRSTSGERRENIRTLT